MADKFHILLLNGSHLNLLAVQIPFIEIHLSNVHAREPFRQHAYLSDIAVSMIGGLGADGYIFALQAAVRRLSKIH